MSMRINQNVLSQSTYANLNAANGRLESSINKLSSGLRINSAGDDAAGLAISEKMRRQIKGLGRAKLNAQDGISMIQTAEGALTETQSIIQRMRELALQSANDTLTSNDRLEIQKEVEELKKQVDSIAESTEFNTKKLLNGNQSALISTSSQYIEGFVSGNVGAGGDYSVSLATVSGGVSQMQTSQILRNRNTGNLCTGVTRLQDINGFYSESGEYALQSTQTLTLTGNGKTTSLTIDGQMTLNDLAASLQNALATSSGLGISNSKVQVMTEATTGQKDNGGYIQITSGFIGEAGEFTIAGSQDILDALGFSVARKAENSMINVTMNDVYGNSRSINTSTDKASQLLDGIDVQFKSQAAQVAGKGGIIDGIQITTGNTVQFSIEIQVSTGSATLVISVASGNWSMEGLAKKIQTEIDDSGSGLAGKGVSAIIVDGELRLTYNPAEADVSDTTIKVSGASQGASEVLGIRNGSYNGFVAGEKDKAYSIEGITKYNSTITATTVKLNVQDATAATSTTALQYATVSVMSTVANGDLLEIKETIANTNTALNGNQKIRLDNVNGSLVFTSTMVGDDENGNHSKIQLTISAGATTAGTDAVAAQLGFRDITSYGSGDTNFNIHVVNTQAQFQIGADAGDNMKICIGDMSTKALGLDKIDLTSVAGAEKSLEKLNQALDKVSAERSRLGAFQNRLDYTISNLTSTTTNLTAAESRIRDVDVASEMMEFTRNQIVTQAATSMLAQANALPQNALSLLG